MIIKIDYKHEQMLKEIAAVKGGDDDFNKIVENFINFMYRAMKIGKNNKKLKEIN